MGSYAMEKMAVDLTVRAAFSGCLLVNNVTSYLRRE
jgi:hypothetical protein